MNIKKMNDTSQYYLPEKNENKIIDITSNRHSLCRNEVLQ